MRVFLAGLAALAATVTLAGPALAAEPPSTARVVAVVAQAPGRCGGEEVESNRLVPGPEVFFTNCEPTAISYSWDPDGDVGSTRVRGCMEPGKREFIKSAAKVTGRAGGVRVDKVYDGTYCPRSPVPAHTPAPGPAPAPPCDAHEAPGLLGNRSVVFTNCRGDAVSYSWDPDGDIGSRRTFACADAHDADQLVDKRLDVVGGAGGVRVEKVWDGSYCPANADPALN